MWLAPHAVSVKGSLVVKALTPTNPEEVVDSLATCEAAYATVKQQGLMLQQHGIEMINIELDASGPDTATLCVKLASARKLKGWLSSDPSSPESVRARAHQCRGDPASVAGLLRQCHVSGLERRATKVASSPR